MTKTIIGIHIAALMTVLFLAVTVSCTGNKPQDQPAGTTSGNQGGTTVDSGSAGTAQDSGDQTVPREEEPEVSITELSKGLRVYNSHNCKNCHKNGDEGSDVGPELTYIGQRMTFSELKAWIPDPKSVKPDAQMPPQDISPEDLEYLAMYLSMLK
jgi:hypothetical protein